MNVPNTSLLLLLFYNLPPHNAFISTTSLCGNNINCAHELILSQNRYHNNLLQSKQRCCKPSTFIFGTTPTQLSSSNLDLDGGVTSRGRGRGGRGGRGRGRRDGRARGGNGRFGDYNSSSQQRGGRNRDPDMRNCKSIGELTVMAYENKDNMSPRGMAAFWTVLSKLLHHRGRTTPKHEQIQMHMHLDQLKGQTLQSIHTYGYRDIATIAISLAKIMKKVVKSGHSKGSPQSILHNALIGNNSNNKKIIFNEIAHTSVPIIYDFEARHLSNLIYAFGLAEVNIPVEDGGTFFDSLAKVAKPLLHQFKPQELSNMLWAFGTVKIPNPQLFKEAGDAIVAFDNLDDFWPQALSNMLWAYSTLGESHPTVFKKIANHIVGLDNLNEFIPQHLSNILWACASAKESHPMLFKKIADNIVSLEDLDRFDAQAFSNILWAYATTGESHPMLFKKLADHIVSLDNLNDFKPQHLSNSVWSYTTAKESHPELFKKVGNHIVTLDHLYSFNGQDCSNTVWAYASAGESHPELFKKVADHIASLDNLNSFTEQALSNTVWAYSTAKELHPTLFQKLSVAAIKRQNEFNSQGIANFLWAYTTNGQVDKKLFSSLVPTVKANLGKCSEQDLANIAWAYAVANVDAPSVFNDEFINACIEKEDEFELEALFQLHQWQLWQEELKSNVSLPPSLQKMCYNAFVSKVPEPSKLQDDVISQLSSMELELEEEVLTKSGYRLDALVEVNGERVGVEVDGPSHFLGRNPTGSTILKHRQVTNLDGIPVVSVPYWEWNKFNKDSEKKQQYLRSLLIPH